jgi:lipid II:glycine glycyltransferase (peptidoglycan interpeptide bridge formation enzyme)
MSKQNNRAAICTANEYATALQQIEADLPESVSFLQSPLYGALQTTSGKPVAYAVARDESGKPVACALAVMYSAPLGMSFLYCPYGPVGTDLSRPVVLGLADSFRQFAHEQNCAFIRLDLEPTASVALPSSNAVARAASLQPRAEWVLDISGAADDIWMGFHRHARYNVRLAERANAIVTVYRPSDAPLDTFYELMQTTAERDTFGIFDRAYYKAYLDTMHDDDGFMIVCTIDDKPAAAALFVTHDEQTHYVFAGSSNDFRKIAPAYTVIWHAIQASKARGYKLFNFGGIQEAVKGHDLGGVTGFKKRFGGFQVNHPNPTDLPYSGLKYRLFQLYKTVKLSK